MESFSLLTIKIDIKKKKKKPTLENGQSIWKEQQVWGIHEGQRQWQERYLVENLVALDAPKLQKGVWHAACHIKLHGLDGDTDRQGQW